MNQYTLQGHDSPQILVFNEQFSFIEALKSGHMIDDETYEAFKL